MFQRCFLCSGLKVFFSLHFLFLSYIITEYVMQYLLICALFYPGQVYKWTGDNMFFIKGDMDSLAFGGGRWARNLQTTGATYLAIFVIIKFDMLSYLIQIDIK